MKPQPQRKALTVKMLREKFGGRSNSSIYRDLEAGWLPKPFKINGRVYWWEDEVESHIAKMNGIAGETV
jgi:predicted DNA-binding transcriptional regulator AlpA